MALLNVLVFSILFSASIFDARVHAQCPPPAVNIHEMFTDGGTHTIVDSNGQRQIKATAYSVNGCEDIPGRTGTDMPLGTRLQRDAVDTLSENCYIPQDASYRRFESFRALVVRNNGWRSTATFNITGVSTGRYDTSFTDIVAVVGFDGTTQVDPIVTSSSVYRKSMGTVPGSATGALGISIGDITIPSVEYGLTERRVCWGSDAAECIISFKFNDRIDTIAILFGTTQISEYSTSSAIFVSGIEFGCECRCAAIAQGAREITVPVPGFTDECVKATTSNSKIECDMLGTEWCEQQPYQRYAVTGSQLPDGNYPCDASAGTFARVIESFNEVTPF